MHQKTEGGAVFSELITLNAVKHGPTSEATHAYAPQ